MRTGANKRLHKRRQRVAISGHAESGAERKAGAGKTVESGVEQGGEDFPHPVGAEIHAEHRIAVAQPGIVADHRGGDEFVGLAGRVARGNCRVGGGEALSLAGGDQLIGLGHTLPALVAVHGVIAADDADDLSVIAEPGLEVAHIAGPGVRRGVAPVHPGVNHHRDAGGMKQRRQGDGMVLMRMHAAGRNEAEQMRGAFALLQPGDEILERRVLRQRTVFDCRVDARQFLHHHAAGADIQMADLGIAHLSLWQADRLAAGGQEGVRRAGPEPVEVRRLGQGDGIVVPGFIPAETVENDEHHGFCGHVRSFMQAWGCRRTCRAGGGASRPWPAKRRFGLLPAAGSAPGGGNPVRGREMTTA